MTAGFLPARRLVLAAVPALLASRAARSQEPGRTYRIGVLSPNPRSFGAPAFLIAELRRLGFVEGKNLIIDPRGFGLRSEQFPAAAAELVQSKIDVIVAVGPEAVRAAKEATATLPILGVTGDMLGWGFVGSMAHPGGNLTGLSIFSNELDGKRQEILMEILPGARRIAALADPRSGNPHLQELHDAAQARGAELSIYPIARPDEIIAAIDAAKAAGAAGLNVLASPLLEGQRQLIIKRTAAVRLPAMYEWPDDANEGGLAGYGPRKAQIFGEIWAGQLARLLKGAKPADLPIQQPTKFELTINLNTAKALGLSVPQSLLQRADEVIE